MLTVARDWAAVDPEAAANWASTLEDKIVRDGALTAIGSRWVRRDPDGMGKWLQANVDEAGVRDLLISHVFVKGRESIPSIQKKIILSYIENKELRKAIDR